MGPNEVTSINLGRSEKAFSRFENSMESKYGIFYSDLEGMEHYLKKVHRKSGDWIKAFLDVRGNGHKALSVLMERLTEAGIRLPD